MLRLPAFLARYAIYYPSAFLGGKNVALYLSQLSKSQYWPAARLAEHQAMRLARILSLARLNVPFYASRIPAGPNVEITTIPLTTKAHLREQASSMRNPSFKGLIATKTTGGSTGEPTTVLKNPKALARELGATWRGYSWAGIGIGDRQARFWSVPAGDSARRKAKLTDFVCNRTRLSAFDFDQDRFNGYLSQLQLFEPKYAYGYVSMLRQFADFLGGAKQIESLKAIVTTAEALEPEDRQVIEHGFGVRVYNEYGSAELGTIAHECEHGKLHISCENLLVEILDADGKSVVDEDGEIVVTDLDNVVMPLIRYQTGDIGRISTESCACGRSLPILGAIRGRAYDILVNSAGRQFHGSFFTGLFADLKRAGLGVRAFQVVQKSTRELHIRFIPDASTSERSFEFIRQRIGGGFDQSVVVSLEAVTRIEREPSGKTRVVKRA